MTPKSASYPVNRLHLVMFDLAGTTVDDRANGSSLVVRALADAFAACGVAVSEEALHLHRGKEKRTAIRNVLRDHTDLGEHQRMARASLIYDRFLEALRPAIAGMREIDGASATFQFLRGRGSAVAVGSGFPQTVVDAIVDRLGWQRAGLIQYAGSAEQVGASRPDPAMIFDAMQELNISGPDTVLKVGDTALDIAEGRNAGVRTVGVLTGSQTEERLWAAGADFVLPSIKDLPAIFSITESERNLPV